MVSLNLKSRHEFFFFLNFYGVAYEPEILISSCTDIFFTELVSFFIRLLNISLSTFEEASEMNSILHRVCYGCSRKNILHQGKIITENAHIFVLVSISFSLYVPDTKTFSFYECA